MGLNRNRFIEKSVLGAVSFFKDSVFAEEYAAKKGFLQSIGPCVKMIGAAIIIIAALFIRNIAPILTIYCFVLFLAILSRINLIYFLKRTWIFIPLFSLFIVIPALFSIISPGDPVCSFRLFNISLHITQQGLVAAGLFVSRVITSVSIVVLLSLTTRHTQILHTLYLFGIPPVFIMTINMCYRYIYLFTKIVEETFLALKSRVGTAVYSKQGQRIVSWNIANLWRRSFYLHKDVYNAMVSRGYRGGE